MKNNKRNSSLATLVGIVPVIVSTIFLCAAAALLLSRIVRTNVRQQVELSLATLDGQITAVFAPYEIRLRDVAAVVRSGASKTVLDGIIHEAEDALGGEDLCDIYYATVVSRYEEGGYFLDGLDWNPDEDWIPSTRDWWKDAVALHGKVAYGEPYIDAMGGALCITLSYAAYTDGGELVGVAAVDIYLTALTDIVGAIRVSQSGKTYLVDANGLYLTHEDGKKRLEQNYLADNAALSERYSAETYLDNTEKAFTLKNRYYGVKRVSNLAWYIVTDGEQRDFTREISGSVTLLLAVLAAMVVLFPAVEIYHLQRRKRELEEKVEERTRELRIASERAEQLLLNILPEEVATELTEHPNETIAKQFPNVTVLFTDIVGFTKMSGEMSAEEVVTMLNKMITLFDERANREGIEKIKTIGDAYMAATGFDNDKSNHWAASRMVGFAQGLIDDIRAFNKTSPVKVQIRIGINTGELVAGVIGKSKFIYDIWGDTVNVASRMESTGEPMRIHVSETTYEQTKKQFAWSAGVEVNVKGKGEMKTYFL